jgi:hypothetical protein
VQQGLGDNELVVWECTFDIVNESLSILFPLFSALVLNDIGGGLRAVVPISS